MDCQRAATLISGRLDHECESADRHALDAHLQECDRCRMTVEAFQDQDRALRDLYADCQAAGLRVADRVIAQLHALPRPEAEDAAATERRRLRRFRQRRAWALALAATVGGLLYLSHTLLHPPEAPV